MNDKPISMIENMPVKHMTVEDFCQFGSEALPIINALLNFIADCHLNHYLDPKSRKMMWDSWRLLEKAYSQLELIAFEKLSDENRKILKNKAKGR